MILHEIETYREFRVRMTMDETRTQWMCEITFERLYETPHADVPPRIEKNANKSEVGALNFSMAMQHKARVLIDEWLASRKN
jgi:hypothetical protein